MNIARRAAHVGAHRSEAARPACTCVGGVHAAGWWMHDEHCAIRVEAHQRLFTGKGGTR